MAPGSLCGSGYTADTSCVGFSSNDPVSLMTFGAAKSLCSAAASGTAVASDNCDRITGMAVYDNQGTGSGRRVHLIYWPYKERLTELQMSDNSTAISGTGSLTWTSGSAKTLTLSASCTPNQNCLGDQVVVGDTLALAGCTCAGGTYPTVTTVSDGNGSSSSLTINNSITSAYGSGCTSGQSFTYTGWFVTPAHDATPLASAGGYPGNAVTVSVNCTSTPCASTSAVIWAILPSSDSVPVTMDRGLGTLYTYKALPNSSDQLTSPWNSTDTWCASSFARPSVVHGNVYVPTYAVSSGTRTFSSCKSCGTGTIGDGNGPYPSGLQVYR